MCINVLVKIIRVTIKADKRMSENNIIVVSFVELKTTFEDVLATFNSFVSDISVDCNDFDAGFLITYRKI